MRDSMARGGPDDQGTYIHPEMPFALGHRRLALIDLTSAGHQPMQTPDGRLRIIYNGEIYNFLQIRSELLSLGYRFTSQSDTEVILYSYLEWGTRCFSRFNGMFALAIWDEKEGEAILARDHAGMKPLYYHLSGDRLVFASEVRAFTAMDPAWPHDEDWRPVFLVFGHLPEPITTLQGVQMLRKGSWMKVKLPSLHNETGCFYREEYNCSINDQKTAFEAIRDILPRAVERHLISDAPIGLFLSGGVDSSLLTLLAAPLVKDELVTLSIKFAEAGFSEEIYQKLIIDATGAKHRTFQVGQKDFEKALPDIMMAMDQPSTDGVNTYFISKYAASCGLKAVLSGLGADEIFGGYPSFTRFHRWRWLRFLPKFVSRSAGHFDTNILARLSYDRLHPMLSLYLTNRGLFTLEQAARRTGISLSRLEDAIGRIELPQDIDYSSCNSNVAMELDLYMKNQLLKDSDYMSMWHGVEIRMPFLDKELVDTVNNVAPLVKFQPGLPKSLLVQAFSAVLPAEIWRRKKQGFTFPFAYWLKQSSDLHPSNELENEYYDRFISEKAHWSRYWAIKLAGMEHFGD